MRAIKGLIRQIHKKVKKSGSKGFSLAEMLFAVLILLLASQLIAESMRLASAHYTNYTNVAHAQMIMSTLTDFVRSEITTASEIDDGTNGITFLDGSGLIGGRCKIVDGDTLYLQSIKEPDRKYYPIVGMKDGGPHDYAEKLEVTTVFEKKQEPSDSDPTWIFNLSVKVADIKGRELANGKYEIEVPGEVKDN